MTATSVDIPTRATEPTTDITARRFTTLDAAMLATLALVVTLDGVAALLGVGWVTAMVTLVASASALAACLTRPAWRPLLLRLIGLGLVMGFVELFTDYSGEIVARSLIYPPNEPMLWASPLYMPFSWAVTLTLIGYLAWRLWTLLPGWLAIILSAVWGAINIPFYEELAYHANWWRYAAAPSIGHTPYYVLLFEGLTCAIMPLLVARLETRRWWSVALRGLALGVWAPWCALFAWLLLGR